MILSEHKFHALSALNPVVSFDVLQLHGSNTSFFHWSGYSEKQGRGVGMFKGNSSEVKIPERSESFSLQSRVQRLNEESILKANGST